MDNLILIQGIGFIGLIFSILAFQFNKRKYILYLHMASNLAFSFHLALLSAWTGAIMCIIGALRNYIFEKRDHKKWAESSILLYTFILIFLITGILSWGSIISILPIIGMVVGTISLWLKNPTHIRLMILIPTVSWLIYYSIVNSYAGILETSFILASTIIGIIRFDLLSKKRK